MSEEHQDIIDQARRAREHALAEFSSFRVGAAVETTGGRVFSGCNIENATYGLTVCAERVAVWKALSEGERSFARLAIYTDAERLTPPCGACRQIIWEFCGDIPVVIANARGDSRVHQMRDLLPQPFDASSLETTENEIR